MSGVTVMPDSFDWDADFSVPVYDVVFESLRCETYVNEC